MGRLRTCLAFVVVFAVLFSPGRFATPRANIGSLPFFASSLLLLAPGSQSLGDLSSLAPGPQAPLSPDAPEWRSRVLHPWLERLPTRVRRWLHRTQDKYLVALALFAICAVLLAIDVAGSGRFHMFVTGEYEVQLNVTAHDRLGFDVDDDDKLHMLVSVGQRGGSVWSCRDAMGGREARIDTLKVGTTVQFGEVDHKEGVVRVVRPVTGWMYMDDGKEDGEDFFDGDSLVVRSVQSGPVQLWNMQHWARAVQPGCRVVAVNGVRGGARVLMKMLLDADGALTLRISRAAGREPRSTGFFDQLCLWWRPTTPPHARDLSVESSSDVHCTEFRSSTAHLQAPQEVRGSAVHLQAAQLAEARRLADQATEAATSRAELRKAEAIRERAALAEVRACERVFRQDVELARVQEDLHLERRKSHSLSISHSMLADEHVATKETLRSEIEAEARDRVQHQETAEAMRGKTVRIALEAEDREAQRELAAKEVAQHLETAEVLRTEMSHVEREEEARKRTWKVECDCLRAEMHSAESSERMREAEVEQMRAELRAETRRTAELHPEATEAELQPHRAHAELRSEQERVAHQQAEQRVAVEKTAEPHADNMSRAVIEERLGEFEQVRAELESEQAQVELLCAELCAETWTTAEVHPEATEAELQLQLQRARAELRSELRSCVSQRRISMQGGGARAGELERVRALERFRGGVRALGGARARARSFSGPREGLQLGRSAELEQVRAELESEQALCTQFSVEALSEAVTGRKALAEIKELQRTRDAALRGEAASCKEAEAARCLLRSEALHSGQQQLAADSTDAMEMKHPVTGDSGTCDDVTQTVAPQGMFSSICRSVSVRWGASDLEVRDVGGSHEQPAADDSGKVRRRCTAQE